MANYPKEFEDLLQEYLTDGIITAQERKVLLNKAAKLGLDVDEIDLYIDAQQQKADQQVDAAVRKQRGQSCPFCGGSVPQLADKCPHCGQHISAEASDELKEVIENLEEALVDFKSGEDFARSKANVEKYMRKAQLYYSSNPKIQTLIEQVKQESEIAEKKAKSDATKKTLIKILTYNKWITAIVIIMLIGSIVSGVSALCSKMEKSHSELAAEALERGDLSKAADLLSQFPKDNAQRIKVTKELVKAGQYDDALTASGYDGTYYHKESYDLLALCVGDMLEKGEKEKAKRFINFHYTWNQYSSDQDDVKERLLALIEE